MLSSGVKAPLQQDDLWETWTDDKPDTAWREFDAGWRAEVQRAHQSKRPPSLWSTLARVYGRSLLLVMAVYAYVVADTLLAPQFLDQLVQYSEDAGLVSVVRGYQYCLLLFGSLVLAAICRTAALHLSFRLFLRLRNALMLALYRKSLRVPTRLREDGKLNNLLATDLDVLADISSQINAAWSAPIIIGFGVWELYGQVGWSAFVGLAVIVASFPLTGLLLRNWEQWSEMESSTGDRRIGLTNELVAGIRLIKYYAWEKPLMTQLTRARDDQIVWLHKLVTSNCMFMAALNLLPVFVSVAVFAAYAGTGGHMTPSVVFTSLTLIAIIRTPFTTLSDALATLAHARVALRRIASFLCKPDIDLSRIGVLERPGVEVEGAQFDWGEAAPHTNSQADDGGQEKAGDSVSEVEVAKSETSAAATEGGVDKAALGTGTSTAPSPILTNVTFSAGRGELVLIIGPVGSGKSSLLCGLLGEVGMTAGRVAIGGKLAYVPQTAFIINATLRDNILFGAPYDPILYRQCLTACALDDDVAMLPAGDLTEIGERGINISGGQKQRISIARAAYAVDSSVVLLDDPLSAVDAHVSDHLFHQCIAGPAMAGRTRILVTHSIAYVDYADRIVMMKRTDVHDCYTVKTGTANQLRAEDEEFRAILDAYNRGREQCGSHGEKEQQVVRETASPGGDHGCAMNRSGEIVNSVDDEVELADWATTEANADTAAATASDPQHGSVGSAKDASGLVELEEREVGQVTWAVYKYFIVAGGTLLLYIVLPLTFVAAQAMQTSSDFWLAMWSNSLTGDGGALSSATHSTGEWLGAYGALAFGTMLSTATRTYYVCVLNTNATRRMHHDLLQSTLRRSVSWFDRTPAGRILNRFTRDLGGIDVGLAIFLETVIALTLTALGAITVIAIIVPITLAVVAPLVPVLVWIAWFYRKSSIELRRLESVTRSPINDHISETLGGCVAIRAVRAQQRYVDELDRRMDANSRPIYYVRAVGCWLRIRLELMAAVVVGASTVLAVGGQHAGFSSLSPGAFGLLISYALTLAQLLTSTVHSATAVASRMNSVERLRAYSAATNHEQWDATNQSLSDSVKGGHWPSTGRVQLKGLQLRYRPELDLVLRGVSVDIMGGSRVGVVGRTGSGKSSLLVALFRMVEPCGGDILVDGVPLRELSLHDVRSNLSILPQEAVLFTGTVRYNLDPFGRHHDKELWSALQAVQLKPLVLRMPQQLDSEVSECGVVLSAGQKQLLCLARALLRRPKVLCLDEATANVDLATDELIQRVIRQQLSGTTLITIAHRINTVLDYDRIIVMDKGMIAEYGTPTELRRMEGGIFASMLMQTGNTAATAAE